MSALNAPRLPPPATLPSADRHNGQSLDPILVELVLRETAAGESLQTIVRRHRVSLSTVQGIRRHYGQTLAKFKAELADTQEAVAACFVDTLAQGLANGKYDDCPANDLSLVAARLLESSAKLRGEPTQRIEVSHNLGLDELKATLASIKEAKVLDVATTGQEVDQGQRNISDIVGT